MTWSCDTDTMTNVTTWWFSVLENKVLRFLLLCDSYSGVPVTCRVNEYEAFTCNTVLYITLNKERFFIAWAVCHLPNRSAYSELDINIFSFVLRSGNAKIAHEIGLKFSILIHHCGDCVVGLVTRLRGWTIRGAIPGRDKRFSLLQNVQIGSGAHPVFCSQGKGKG